MLEYFSCTLIMDRKVVPKFQWYASQSIIHYENITYRNVYSILYTVLNKIRELMYWTLFSASMRICKKQMLVAQLKNVHRSTKSNF